MPYSAQAPGSMMLLGEYAVLEGHAALVCAINRHIAVMLTPREDQQIHIHSVLGHHVTTRSTLIITPPFQFVLATLQYHGAHLTQGCDLEITADFSDQMGFGSSAAVTVATLSVLSQWLSLHLSQAQLLEQGRAIVQAVQGMGSGADVAASVYGGIVHYCNILADEAFHVPIAFQDAGLKPLSLLKQSSPSAAELACQRFKTRVFNHFNNEEHIVPSLVAIYAGYKTPTPVVVRNVQARFADTPTAYQEIIESISQCVERGVSAIEAKQWGAFGEAMQAQQQYMVALGVSDKALEAALQVLNQLPDVLGAKISGAGLGDCVVGLTATEIAQSAPSGHALISLAIAQQGVRDVI